MKYKDIDFASFKITPVMSFVLMKISQTKFKNPIHIQELKQLLGSGGGSEPYFSVMKDLLIAKGIAIQKDSWSSQKTLDINIKKLDALIEETETYQKVVEYIKFKNPFYII